MVIPVTYKDYHETFMENNNGTSIFENVILITPAPLATFLSVCACTVISLLVRNPIVIFIVEFMVLVFLQLLIFTILSDYVLLVLVFLLLVVGVICGYIARNIRTKELQRALNWTPSVNGHRAVITYYRSIIGILTAICILAVDFQMFPRRFAKTETFGFSLMDTGVGFYVLSNAVVMKPKKVHNMSAVKKIILGSGPLIALGIFRIIFVVSSDYHTHVSEYGKHWNFFFTLAVVKVMSEVLLGLWPTRPLPLSIFIGGIHQLGLYCGLQDWALQDMPRTGFLTANREGILSLPGYLSLYFAGVCIGQRIRQKNRNLRKNLKDISNFLLISAILFLVMLYCYCLFDISRRLVNMTYILWMVSLTLLLLSIFLLLELGTVAFLTIYNIENYAAHLTPIILQAVNQNPLIFFLLANLLTGAVNFLFKTLYLSKLFSTVVLTCYLFLLSSIMFVLYSFNIRVKF